VITQASVDAFINQVINLGLLIGCPGSAILAWVMVVRFLRRGDDDFDNAGTWFIMAISLTIVAAIVLFGTWYRSLPSGGAQ
jgi:uncharacterized membrane protein YidH (DUF202 family)